VGREGVFLKLTLVPSLGAFPTILNMSASLILLIGWWFVLNQDAVLWFRFEDGATSTEQFIKWPGRLFPSIKYSIELFSQ
jgi:hypothetical protein